MRQSELEMFVNFRILLDEKFSVASEIAGYVIQREERTKVLSFAVGVGRERFAFSNVAALVWKMRHNRLVFAISFTSVSASDETVIEIRSVPPFMLNGSLYGRGQNHRFK